MTRLFCVLCAFCLLVGLVGCGSIPAESSTPAPDAVSTTEPSTTTASRTVTTIGISTSNKSSTTRKTSKTTTRTTVTTKTTTAKAWEDPVAPQRLRSLRMRFAIPQLTQDVVLKLPEGWIGRILRSDGHPYLSILRNGRTVGRYTPAFTPADMAQSTVLTQEDRDGIPLTTRRYRDGTVTYSATFDLLLDFCVTLEIDASLIGKEDFMNCVWSNGTVDAFRDDNRLSPKDNLRIAVAGNSYINSSGVALELQNLITATGKSATVTKFCYGGFSTRHFPQRTDFMDAIRSGTYDILFMCGLFSLEDAQAMSVIETACLEGGTQLVLFPAYNENYYWVSQAYKNCSTAKLVHWQEGTKYLTYEGVLPRYLMIDDSHLHARPLAGYAGAVMMYTSLYGYGLTDVKITPVQSDLGELGLTDAQQDALYQQVRRLAVEYTHIHTEIIQED